ncbi:MAG: hypothetical protein K6G85_02995 [Eubacterium sp.]|nr:hypothetical protein [Eubacterium sp.]
MKKRMKVFAMAMSMAMVATMTGGVNVSAKSKTTYRYVNTERKDYSINAEGNLYLESEYKYAYDKKGNETLDLSISYDQAGNVNYESKWITKYDKKNRIKTKKSYDAGKVSYTEKYTYKKNKTIQKDYDETKKLVLKIVTTKKKQKETIVYYNGKGKKLTTTTVLFDKKGHVVSEVVKKGKEILDETKKTYKKNVLTKEVRKSYTEEGYLSNKTESIYKKGKLLQEKHTMYEDGDFNSSWIHDYTYKGKYTYDTETFTSCYDDEVAKTVTKFKYDKGENRVKAWTKIYDNDNLTSTITYKNELYTSGKVKGFLKKEEGYREGKLESRTTYKFKRIKVKVKK